MHRRRRNASWALVRYGWYLNKARAAWPVAPECSDVENRRQDYRPEYLNIHLYGNRDDSALVVVPVPHIKSRPITLV
jgi:hypothetical protein